MLNGIDIHKEQFRSQSTDCHGRFWTIEDLALLFQEKYDVEYKSRTSYINLLHQCGFSYQKTEKVFKNHSAEKIADFEEFLEKTNRCRSKSTQYRFPGRR
jgi:transposase